MSIQFIACGVAKGTLKRYKCNFCEFESDDIDDFATSMCWDCVYDDPRIMEVVDDSEGSEPTAW